MAFTLVNLERYTSIINPPLVDHPYYGIYPITVGPKLKINGVEFTEEDSFIPYMNPAYIDTYRGRIGHMRGYDPLQVDDDDGSWTT